MDRLILKAEKRDCFGNSLAVLREQGRLPAVFYGPKEKSQSIFVPLIDFLKVWRAAGESTVVELDLAGTKKNVLIYDVDLDPLTNEPRHVDFYVVDMAKKITASVPLEFEGEAPAVKLGGVLVKVIHEVEVEALPANLPYELKIDVSSLKSFEDKVTVKDIQCPSGVEILAEPENVVALVEEAKEEEAETPEEAPSIEDIEVTTEKKPKTGEGDESSSGESEKKEQESTEKKEGEKSE
jgi:large subunit ribosomal protein L25